MLCGMWASNPALAITAEDKAELERIVRSGRTEQRHALRARIILGAAEGRSNNALAKELKTSRPTVVDWRARYVEGGVKALYEDRPRGKSFEAVARSKEAEIVAKTQSPPANATHWSCRRMAETCGVSKASVQRIWQAHGLKPHLVKTFKLSNDPHFIEKLEDVVGGGNPPPEAAIVKVRDAVPVPPLLVAVMVDVNTPAVLGVPETKPLPVLTVRPPGNPVAL